jgi:hypothetical protein
MSELRQPRHVRRTRWRSDLAPIADMPLRCGNRREWDGPALLPLTALAMGFEARRAHRHVILRENNSQISRCFFAPPPDQKLPSGPIYS